MVVVEDLETCAKCGAQAQVHPYPADIGNKMLYVVDCMNHYCSRPLFTEPKFETESEAISNWNNRQRTEKAGQ